MDGAIYFVYRSLSPLLIGLVKLFGPLTGEKIRLMNQEREDRNYTPLLAPPIWIHAASGEIEYAKPVLRELRRQYPELPLLLTYFSPSAKRLLPASSDFDLALALPWDHPKEVRKFLEFYRPRCGLIARTDLWPNLLTECSRKKIPVALFSATFSEKSDRLKWGRRALFRWTLAKLERIFCVSAEDQLQFELLHLRTPVEVVGDTRYDQAIERIRNPKTLPQDLAPKAGDFVFIAGSTWPEDEKILIQSLTQLKNSNIRTILVPHEVHEKQIATLERNLKESDLESQRFSLGGTWQRDRILIVDQVGKLADLYAWANVAFVGGSFREKVHSVMEPLAAGLPVIVGPHHQNNREALQFQKQQLANGECAVSSVLSSEELARLVLKFHSHPAQKGEIKSAVEARAGASKKVVDWVQHLIRP